VGMGLYEGSWQVLCRVNGHHIYITHSLHTHLPSVELHPTRSEHL